MPEYTNTSQEVILTENVNIIFSEFNNSMTALQTQDVSLSQKSHLKAKNAFKILSQNINTNDIVPYRIMLMLIEVSTSVIISSHMTLEERYIKALEELNEADINCKKAALDFKDIPDVFINDPEFGGLIPLFRNMFSFYETIIKSLVSNVKSEINKEAGKYVNEVQVFKNMTDDLRRINTIHLEYDKTGLTDTLVTMVNKMADIYERKTERLEEKRKRIEFLRPIDKKIFIVHGHNIAALHELTNMLKDDHGLDPIILSEMPDKGHTVIEKFEEYARYCAFAFVIVTPDDFVENKKKKYFQGRPNVLFELGWFCGRYGRDKVRILRQKDTQLPSDLNGLVTIDFHENLEEVYRKITADLEFNGIIDKENELKATE